MRRVKANACSVTWSTSLECKRLGTVTRVTRFPAMLPEKTKTTIPVKAGFIRNIPRLVLDDIEFGVLNLNDSEVAGMRFWPMSEVRRPTTSGARLLD